MKTRTEKYSDNHQPVRSRVNKNERIYKEVSELELKSYNPNNNVRVIGDNDDNIIDVEKIRNLLEKNYKDMPKRKPIMKVESSQFEGVTDEPTKEYDINSILEKAREEKEVNYDKERLKKVHDTQYDILNSLELEKKLKEEEEKDLVKNAKEDELMSLINTITSKELEQTTNVDPLDILSDLKGGDNTQVLSGIEEEIKKTETQELMKQEQDQFKNSFYTTTNAFTQSDFDDFNDLKSDVKDTKVVVKVLIALIVIAFIIGALILLNSYYNLF